VQSSVTPGKVLLVASKNACCWAGLAGNAPYSVSSSLEPTRVVRALKAASGTLVVLSRLNVSAWSFAVILPLYDGAIAKTNCLTLGAAGAARDAPHARQ